MITNHFSWSINVDYYSIKPLARQRELVSCHWWLEITIRGLVYWHRINNSYYVAISSTTALVRPKSRSARIDRLHLAQILKQINTKISTNILSTTTHFKNYVYIVPYSTQRYNVICIFNRFWTIGMIANHFFTSDALSSKSKDKKILIWKSIIRTL